MGERLQASPNISVEACRHGTLMFNVHDRFIGRALDLYGEWCEAEIRALAPLLEPGATVIDVGANIGTHTVAFAKMVGPTGQVVAFEPQRVVHQMLCGNVALNGLGNVVALHAAVADRAGHVRIPAPDPSSEINFGAIALSTTDEGEIVEAMPIDALELPACRLLKIDVEGMEPDVIEGAKKTIARCEPALFVENNTFEGSAKLLAAVESVGYRAYWHIAPYFADDNFFGNAENVFAAVQPEANMLCVPKDISIEGLEPARKGDDWKIALTRMAARIGR